MTGTFEVFEFFVANAANINSKDSYGRSPLHIATNRGELSFVKHLVESKCDINAVTNTKSSALHGAASKGFHQIAGYLVQKGIDKDLRDKKIYYFSKSELLCIERFIVKATVS